MTIEHYFVVKWTERDGFVLDDDTLMVRFDDRPLYEVEEDDWVRVPEKGKVGVRDSDLHSSLSEKLEEMRRERENDQ